MITSLIFLLGLAFPYRQSDQRAGPTVKQMEGGVVVTMLPYDTMEALHFSSLERIATSGFWVLGPTSSGLTSDYWTSSASQFIKFVPPDHFYYQLDHPIQSKPIATGTVVHHWRIVQGTDLEFVLARKFLPEEILSFLTFLKRDGVKVITLRFNERAFLRDCAPAVGFDIDLTFVGARSNTAERLSQYEIVPGVHSAEEIAREVAHYKP